MEDLQSATVPRPSANAICPQCHEPVFLTYYFCPNCGKNLKEPPLSTSIATQTGIYIFSIVLPLIAFLAVNRWPAMKYIRSADPKTKRVGIIAMTLMIVTTIIVVWFGIIWFELLVQSMTGGLMGAGNLGI